MRRHAKSSPADIDHYPFLTQRISHFHRIKFSGKSNDASPLLPGLRRQYRKAPLLSFTNEQLSERENTAFTIRDADLVQKIDCCTEAEDSEKIHRAFFKPQRICFELKLRMIEIELVLNALTSDERRGGLFGEFFFSVPTLA